MNYPKMLYKGNQEKYQTIIANDEDHESELLEQGWLEYGELPESDQGMEDPRIGDRAAGSIDGTSVAEQNKELQEQFEASKAEIARLKDVIEKGSAENADLREQLTFFQNEGPKLTASAGDQSTKAVVDYNDLKIDELQTLLDEKGIKYLKRDGKDTLIGLLNAHSN